MYASVGNAVIDQYRKKQVQKKYRERSEVIFDYDNSTEESIFLNDLQHNIMYKVSLLPSKCRYVYELSRNHHKTNKEIAASLGISEKTVENHLTKALNRLRLSLEHYMLLVTVLLMML